MQQTLKILFGIVLVLAGMASPLKAQIKLHANGKTTFGPIPSAMQNERVVIYGGQDKALQMYVSQPINWWQSSSVAVSRQLTVSWVIKYNGADRFYVLGNGDLIARGSWFYSDSTLKHKIETIQSPLQSLAKLRGVTFYYKPEVPCKDCHAPDDEPGATDRKKYGLIAQEVEQVFPEMVMEDNQKKKLVAYDQMIPVLVEAIKAQQVQIDAMQQEINTLKRRK